MFPSLFNAAHAFVQPCHSILFSGPGKVPWKLPDVRTLACEIKANLPLTIAQVLESPDWRGGPLVQLCDTISTPKADDLVLNYHFMMPIIKRFRDRVPSQYFLGDVVLYLNKMHHERLLCPTEEGDSRVSLAVDEAKKLKLLIGALRTLWRNSTLLQLDCFCLWEFLGPNPSSPVRCHWDLEIQGKESGSHPRITEMKTWLLHSPTRGKKAGEARVGCGEVSIVVL